MNFLTTNFAYISFQTKYILKAEAIEFKWLINLVK